MKIITIGFLSFLAWSAFSEYIYVCKIRGFCYEPKPIEMVGSVIEKIVIEDTLTPPLNTGNLSSPGTYLVYFEFDKSEFKSNPETDNYFDKTRIFLNQNSKARLSITGHTDATGTDNYNENLGFRRAQRMQDFFENKGLPANRLIIESKGENEPADNNNTVSGRANNRRAVITINN
jgi:outer membrane protein OmpA-like peptidoglycan-associated protein